MTVLSEATCSSLSIPVPSYDRSRRRTGIVHFGVGGFHRAHQAMYLDRLMESGEALDWAICGVGVMPFDLKMKRVIAYFGEPGEAVDRGAIRRELAQRLESRLREILELTVTTASVPPISRARLSAASKPTFTFTSGATDFLKPGALIVTV